MKISIELQHAGPEHWNEISQLIYTSTNQWYEANGKQAIFQGDSSDTLLFFEIYETLDPGKCLMAVDQKTGTITGSCFYRSRETHVALGIMNVHPDYSGHGVARRLLTFILDFAKKENKPVRLVSSAINLDSFSLYNRAGFTPYIVFQDMILTVPENGLPIDCPPGKNLRDAKLSDVPAMVKLEEELIGVRRGRDFEYFIKNEAGYWHMSVIENSEGRLDGFLASIHHPGSALVGPGCMREDADSIALIQRELDARRGGTMVCLVPTDRPNIVQKMYELGAKNCELHFGQSTSPSSSVNGVMIPSFMPETA